MSNAPSPSVPDAIVEALAKALEEAIGWHSYSDGNRNAPSFTHVQRWDNAIRAYEFVRSPPALANGPLFVGNSIEPSKSLESDSLYRLLCAGTASAEDQRYAAGWIATILAFSPPETDASLQALAKALRPFANVSVRDADGSVWFAVASGGDMITRIDKQSFVDAQEVLAAYDSRSPPALTNGPLEHKPSEQENNDGE